MGVCVCVGGKRLSSPLHFPLTGEPGGLEGVQTLELPWVQGQLYPLRL